jgi:phage terminase large subunit
VDARNRLRQLGQLDLGAWVEAATGRSLWSIQRRIGTAVSQRRARVAVPSCNASGKSFLASRLALAFYDAFTPGVPCIHCGGPCGGSKILTTSSTHEHLRDALWSEMRIAYYDLQAKGIFTEADGKMGIGDNLRLESGPDHFIIGKSPKKAEGFQGFHAPHKLILGDEATSLDDEMQQGITGLLATADSRLFLIFNPTTDDTYAALETRSKRTEVIRIRAWDTPHFTGEEVPEGANLTTPEWIEELQEKGMGPGTYEWTTRVEAEFWSHGDDVLITTDMYDAAAGVTHYDGTRAIGVDLAPYGSDENVIAYRSGNGLVKLEAFPAMRPDLFFEGPVMRAVESFDPDYLIFDADGVGAGVIGDAERVAMAHNRDGKFMVLLPFRGGLGVETAYINTRSAWWWALRRRFLSGGISLATFPGDSKLREQITDIHYSVTAQGNIKIEPKDVMKRRGRESPDRADAVMYSFALVDELPHPTKVVETPVLDMAGGLPDRSEAAMWKRDKERLRRRGQFERPTPWRSIGEGELAWDD